MRRPARRALRGGEAPLSALRALIVAEAVAILVLAGITAARFTVWAQVDERAHYAYVQTVAEEQRLPRLDDLVSPEVQAITDRTFPAPSPNDPAAAGLAGRNYEAFQPPLYYLLAAPAFAVPVDHEAKVYVLRALGVLLLAAALALLYLLARAVFGDRWEAPLAMAFAVCLWPGVIVRAVTVSNAALELPLAIAFTLAAYTAHRHRSPRALYAAGALLGLALLTKLTLVFLAPLLLIAALRVPRRRQAAIALALPALLLAPWLASNLARHDALTTNAQALEQQAPYLYPDGRPDAGDLPARVAALPRGSLPQEWFAEIDEHAAIAVLAFALPLLLLAAALPDLRRHWLLALPVALALLMLCATFVSEDHDVLLLRYVVPALVPFALLAGRRWAIAATAAAAAALWVWMAGTYYFTDVGRSLGIG